jgi:uncharacterized protein (TIGR03545 family)
MSDGAAGGGEGGAKPGKKAGKPPKPAAIFREPIDEASFQKKYLGLIEQAADRAFLESSLVLADGKRTLREGLDRDALLRLNKLGKAIKANRGVLKTGPLVLATLLASAILVFALFFMNPLLGRAIERGLESAFGARAEVSGFRLDLFRLRVAMRSLAVADRDKPMSNLFETGRIELKLDPGSLLRGKVYVQEASAASISLGGARAVSGALPETPAKPEPAKAAPSAPSASLLDFSHFDAPALLDQEKSRLSSLAAYEKAGAAYDEASKRWKDRAASSQKGVAALASASKPLLALDPKSIKSPEAAMKAASDIKALIDSAKSTAKEASAVASGLRSDSGAAASLEKEARASLDRDYEYLKSFVDFRSGAAASLLEPILKQVLSAEGEKYYHYGSRALETALSLAKKQEGDKAAAKAKKTGFGKGRDVRFPAAALPRFRLGHLGASFLQDNSSWTVDLREVSTDPSLVPFPSTLEASMVAGSESASLKTVLDLRKEASQPFSLEARVQGIRADLGDSFAAAGLGGLTGNLSGKLDALGEVEGGFGAHGSLELGDPSASRVSGAIGEALASGIASAKTIDVDIGYEHPRSGEDRYSVRTSLDSLVEKAARVLAARYSDKAEAQIKAALRDYAGKELEGKLGSKVELDKILSSSLGDEKTASSLTAALGDKEKSLESRAKDLGTKALGIKLPKLP